ncbi:NACHT, LRR and PYD domains-containing protein 1 homolog isoform X3 [Gadus chalcogrammus]|uniref:NACHT, LRR and PYD domains-containing protein 1 homolog isoform X3 n=1 Tax=Gadus chalcogrammus TaxID=1042646 RepID=UPI0024C4A7E5|nr:NACHT, LRR and PYD domains-containing protein 1 homolog isoform X3 [Gadus chalcogrammus]
MDEIQSKVESFHMGTILTEDTASIPLVDSYEEEDCSDSDASAEIDEDDEEEMQIKSHCEKCKAAQQPPEYEKVTPKKISKWSFQVRLEGEGTYECSATGLVFEVSEQALVRYSVLSWSEFSKFLQDSWRPAGSIWNVDVVNKDSSVLKFIHFPHSLCLAEPEHDLSLRVLHVKEQQAVIESTVDFTASHVKWRVSSLSPLGPIISCSVQVKHHGVVLVYKEQKKKPTFTFHVFLALNNCSEIKAIEEQVLSSIKTWMKIDKPPTCRLEEKYHNLKSEPEGKIEPSNLEFTTEVVQLKGFFVVRFDEGPPFELFIRAKDSDEPLWSTTIREEDWNGKKKPNLWKRIKLWFAARIARARTQKGKNNVNHQLRLSGGPGKLQRIRSPFVERVSTPLIKGLLDDLWQQKVLSTEEKDTVMENHKIRADQARCLIDMVMGKGERASEEMINSMKERDHQLCLTLGLISDLV